MLACQERHKRHLNRIDEKLGDLFSEIAMLMVNAGVWGAIGGVLRLADSTRRAGGPRH